MFWREDWTIGDLRAIFEDFRAKRLGHKIPRVHLTLMERLTIGSTLSREGWRDSEPSTFSVWS